MSDEGDDDGEVMMEDEDVIASETRSLIGANGGVDENGLEFVLDNCVRNQYCWLRYPEEFIKPAKMCSVNKYVQCVDEGFLQHSLHHVPLGPEYVLVGHDSPSMPPHMFNWIWAMTQINLMQHYQGCVVPVSGVTKVSYSKKGKEIIAVGIKRRLVVSHNWQLDENLRLDRWFPDLEPEESTMSAAITELRDGDSYYADIPPIQMLWGIIPVEYMLDGVRVRRIVHVLKTIPAPGFDLMRCLVNLLSRRDQKFRNGMSINLVIQIIYEVLNYECNRNLNISGCFGRSHPLPHPMEVLEDPRSPMNPQAVLSPYLVMKKIILQLPVETLDSLIVDGFPRTVTQDERQECFMYYKHMQSHYRDRLKVYHDAFGNALIPKSAKDINIGEVALPLVLTNSDEECMDQVYCYMLMAFNLAKWIDGTTTPERAEMLRFPQLAIATQTPFQYVENCGASTDDFIRAHLGSQKQIVDETMLNRKYSQENGSWGDMPHGGMYRSARESFKVSLKTVGDSGDEGFHKRIITYNNYIRAQSTIHAQSILVDLMMSDRVLHSAQCLDRLGGQINEGIRRAFHTVNMSGNEAKRQRRTFAAYPDTDYFVRFLHILSVNNRFIRANAVNLTTLLSLLISDVLTHLGAHHETWNWMMYTVQVMGGAGHLRALTDDHGGKAQVVFTSKPNSVGFNAVITKMFKSFSTMVSELLPDLSSDFLEPLRFMKLDRTTRSGVEGVSSVMFINGVKESAPSRKTFMRPIIMDEGYRSMDASALNGLVCSIPRDSDGGSGNILKAVDPGKAGGAHLQGHQRQLPGLSPFLLAMTSNSNPHTAVIGECIKTFSVVTAMFPSGAQVGGSLSQLATAKKRKLTDYHSCNTNAASTLPTEKRDREDLAWSSCVLIMAARQLALLNKTGQVDFEINIVCRTFAEWLRNIVSLFFQPFFGGTLYLSYDRVIAGFMTRQVATTFLTTCARHICTSNNITDANTRTLLDMESAPLTLQSCNLALSNALVHLVDTNLILVNQVVRDRLNTPIFPPSFLVDVFGTTPVGLGMKHFDVLFGWLGQMMQFRQGGEIEFNSGYVSINKIGNPQDYQAKEAFLESYFGITKNNYFTFMTAFRECASKIFDLSGFINMEGSCKMTDFPRFAGRLGVGHDSFNGDRAQPAVPAPPPAIHPAFETYRNTYLFTQNQGDINSAIGNTAPSGNQPPQQQMGNSGRPSIGRTWVSLIQHLLVTSIQGEHELHADNIFSFGSNLAEFILNRCAPIQSTPAQAMIYESFQHFENEVVPLRLRTGTRPQYFVRSINDAGAINGGESSELPALLGAHPIEDVMHLGSWIQLATILNNGTKPNEFYTLPNYNGRPPELVRGRNYPLLGMPGTGIRGTICLCPENRMCARIMIYTPEQEEEESVPRPPPAAAVAVVEVPAAAEVVPAPVGGDVDMIDTLVSLGDEDGPPAAPAPVQPPPPPPPPPPPRPPRVPRTESELWSRHVPLIEDWFKVITEFKVMVAPLVFRRFAVFTDDGVGDKLFVSSTQISMHPNDYFDESVHLSIDHGLDIEEPVETGTLEQEQAAERENEQFMDYKGGYMLLHSDSLSVRVPFEEAHHRLLKIGTHILVRVEALRPFGLGCNKTWVRVSLRYPDEGEVCNNILDMNGVYNIFFAVKTRERNNSGPIRIRILHAKAESCVMLNSMQGTAAGTDISYEVFATAMAGVMLPQPPPPPQQE